MDFSILVILWIVFMVIEKFAGNKNKKPPTPIETTDNANFDIPTLPNDPNFPDENITVFQDELKPAELREKSYPQPKIEFKSEKNFRRADSSENKSNLPLNLTADSAMNAIVLSEILGKPKALQRR